MTFRCTCTLMSHVHSPDQRSGVRDPLELLQLDDPLKSGLQVAIFFERPVVPLKDGPLDRTRRRNRMLRIP